MFHKFSEIENTYQKAYLSKITDYGYDKQCDDWLVFEKVDGSNFSFVYDGNTIQHAKRTDIITDPKSFFDYSVVSQKYDDKIRLVFSHLHEIYPNLTCLNLFGELYGGGYPNTPPTHKPINKNIYYCSHIDFIAFDILVQFSDKKEWMAYDEFSPILEKVQLPYLKPLFRGSFQEVLQFPNQFLTTIPKLHGLPDIDQNFAEGVVIKPAKNMHFNNGSRIILKNKIDKFSEKRPRVKSEKEETLNPKFATISDYITENRLHAVVSKMGILTEKDFGKLMKEFCGDIIKDFQKDVPDLTEKEIKEIGKLINKDAQNLVRKYLIYDK